MKWVSMLVIYHLLWIAGTFIGWAQIILSCLNYNTPTQCAVLYFCTVSHCWATLITGSIQPCWRDFSWTAGLTWFFSWGARDSTFKWGRESCFRYPGFWAVRPMFEVGSEVWGRATSLLIVYILQALKGMATIALLFESGIQSSDVLNKSEKDNCIHRNRNERGRRRFF